MAGEEMGSGENGFAHDELIAALLEAQNIDEDDGVVLTRELSERLCLSDKTVRKRIRPLIEAGKVAAVKTKRRDMWGDFRTVPGYRLVE